jgi:hypothetical protein
MLSEGERRGERGEVKSGEGIVEREQKDRLRFRERDGAE